MTPEERQLLNDLNRNFKAFLDIYYRTNFPSRMVLTKKLVMQNNDIDTEGTTGTRIGNSGSKLSLYGVAPVVQKAAISAPAGGSTVDSEARTAINLIRTALKDIGITL